MSESFGSNVTPEATLRFSIEDLYAAGKRLGPVESSLTPPKTTFEQLHRRAAELVRRVEERKARSLTYKRASAIALVVLGLSILLNTYCEEQSGRN